MSKNIEHREFDEIKDKSNYLRVTLGERRLDGCPDKDLRSDR